MRESQLSLEFFNLTRPCLEQHCRDLVVPTLHAASLFRHIYKQQSLEPWTEPTLPSRLKEHLKATVGIGLPTVIRSEISGYDLSVKFLLGLMGGAEVEAVLMPEKGRLTLCVSSQVGCAQACVFCHTGRMGLKRNLSAGEIVGQIVFANQWLKQHPAWLKTARLPETSRLTNIVFMGMGEPLDNPDAVIKAIQIMTDPYGLGLGLAHISVSTAGHLAGLEKLIRAIPKVRIALSIHAVDAAKRSRIMPINRRWPLDSVVARLAEIREVKAPPVMFQYTLIRGVNDGLNDAQALAELALKLGAKVNLIPLNDVGPSRLSAPSPEVIQAFRDVLHLGGVRVMVRYSKGQDIAAACGQLVVERASGRPQAARCNLPKR